jgi:hypothetical protein
MSKKYDTSEEIILKQIQRLSQSIIKPDDEEEELDDEIFSPKLLAARKQQELTRSENLQKNLSYLNHNKPTEDIVKGIKQVRKEESRKKKKKNKVPEGERILGPGFLERYGDGSDEKKKKKKDKEREKKRKRDQPGSKDSDARLDLEKTKKTKQF